MQTGAWGCFDEFNRINIEVLSVVAQQILSILSALSAKQTKFLFDGQNIRLVKTCGIFITMNPGEEMVAVVEMVMPNEESLSSFLCTIFFFRIRRPNRAPR